MLDDPRKTGSRAPLRRVVLRVLFTSRRMKAKNTAGPLRKVALTWSGWRDLNPRPLVPQTSALPSCATARNSVPAQSSRTSAVRASQLRRAAAQLMASRSRRFRSHGIQMTGTSPTSPRPGAVTPIPSSRNSDDRTSRTSPISPRRGHADSVITEFRRPRLTGR